MVTLTGWQGDGSGSMTATRRRLTHLPRLGELFAFQGKFRGLRPDISPGTAGRAVKCLGNLTSRDLGSRPGAV